MVLLNLMSELFGFCFSNKIYFLYINSYDPVDKVILERNHLVCGRQLDVQKAQSRDGSQRSGGSMRSRPGPSSMPRSNYNSGYNNYQQDNFNDPFGQMQNNNYNGYGGNMNEGNGNWTSFGQGLVENLSVFFYCFSCLDMVKKVLVDLCDEEIWVVAVVVVVMHLIMAVAVEVVVVAIVEVHRGLHGIKMNIDPVM